jgi:hypothetical protein
MSLIRQESNLAEQTNPFAAGAGAHDDHSSDKKYSVPGAVVGSRAISGEP